MKTSLDLLRPDVAANARAALDDLEEGGIPYAVTSTLRTTAEQVALYAQGRKPLDQVNALRLLADLPAISAGENRGTVTNCDGRRVAEGGTGRSPHQLGIALDVVPTDDGEPVWPGPEDPRWEHIAQAFKAHGFDWGGDWEDFPDRPHYQAKA
jgi:peptidoglycan LD-endopeptidase CwlK